MRHGDSVAIPNYYVRSIIIFFLNNDENFYIVALDVYHPELVLCGGFNAFIARQLDLDLNHLKLPASKWTVLLDRTGIICAAEVVVGWKIGGTVGGSEEAREGRRISGGFAMNERAGGGTVMQ